MRVLFVTHRYPPFGVAGVERVTQAGARTLTAAGHDVTILSRHVTGAPPRPGLDQRQVDDIDIVTITGPRRGLEPSYLDRLDTIFERVLLEVLPDVVIIAHLMDHSPRYVLIAKRWSIPVVMELHDYYQVCERARLERVSGELCDGPHGGKSCEAHCFPTSVGDRGSWVRRTHLFGLALRHADEFICPSRFLSELFCDLGVPRERLNVIHPALPEWMGKVADTRVLNAHGGDRPLHIAALGTVIPHKGQHVLVEALRKARLKSVRCTVIGSVTEPYADEIRQAADTVDGLTLRMYGEYERELLPMLLDGVDLAVVPSVWQESFSIVVREALACGVPVVASRMGALPEAIRDGENGLLFAPGSAVELAAILQSVDADRSRLETLRKGIDESDWITDERRRLQLEDLLSRVVRENRERGRQAMGTDLEAVMAMGETGCAQTMR
jgi:glycosyltransferase involved in cell wall biosynthesis